MAAPFYLMPDGTFPMQGGSPVLIDQTEFEECCCDDDPWCQVTVNYQCTEPVTAGGDPVFVVDAVTDCKNSTDPGAYLSVGLNPCGTATTGYYEVLAHPTIDDAWSRWTSDGSCPDGECWSCSLLMRYKFGAMLWQTVRIFSPGSNIAVPPAGVEQRWATAALAATEARANPANLPATGFAAAQFWVDDNNCPDNRGQVSFLINHVRSLSWTGWFARTPGENCAATYASYTPPGRGAYSCCGTWTETGRSIVSSATGGVASWSPSVGSW